MKTSVQKFLNSDKLNCCGCCKCSLLNTEKPLPWRVPLPSPSAPIPLSISKAENCADYSSAWLKRQSPFLYLWGLPPPFLLIFLLSSHCRSDIDVTDCRWDLDETKGKKQGVWLMAWNLGKIWGKVTMAFKM